MLRHRRNLLALARAGLSVEGVDQDPLTVAVAANIAAAGLAGRAQVPSATPPRSALRYAAVFCDPARRSRDRVFDPRAYSPPTRSWPWPRPPQPDVKAAPGLPAQSIPDGTAAEWISVDREVKETTLVRGEGPFGSHPGAYQAGSGEVEIITVDHRLGTPPLSGRCATCTAGQRGGPVPPGGRGRGVINGSLLDPRSLPPPTPWSAPRYVVYEVREVSPSP